MEALLKSYDALKVDLYGGYVPADCLDDHLSYVVTRATARVAFSGCDYAMSPPQTTAGERTVSEAELETILRALWKIRSGSPGRCGADAALVTLDVTRNSITELYADDFYSGCPWGPLLGRTFIAGLSELSNTLWQLPKD
jgi:hypothetical protein